MGLSRFAVSREWAWPFTASSRRCGSFGPPVPAWSLRNTPPGLYCATPGFACDEPPTQQLLYTIFSILIVRKVNQGCCLSGVSFVLQCLKCPGRGAGQPTMRTLYTMCSYHRDGERRTIWPGLGRARECSRVSCGVEHARCARCSLPLRHPKRICVPRRLCSPRPGIVGDDQPMK